LLFALLLLVTSSTTFSLFVSALLLFLVTIIIRVVVILIRILIFHVLTTEHVVIQVKVVLECIRNEHIVNILSEVHGDIDLVTELVLFLFLHIGAFLGGHAVSEDVEEGLGLDGLHNGPRLIGLLVLLLLLDLLLGRVLSLVGPRYRGTHNTLNLII